MNRMLRSITVTALAAVGSALLAPGCADNNSSLFVDGVLYVKPPQCTVIADPTQPMLGEGTLDLALATSYEAALLVGNQLTSRGSKQTLRTETSRITLNGAEIHLTDSVGKTIADYSVNGAGFVDVSRGEDSGFGLIFAELIPAKIGAILLGTIQGLKGSSGAGQQTRDQVVAKVRVFGSTLGNEDVTSSEFSFPITYCEGCLIRYPVSAVNPNQHTCSATATDQPTGGCTMGQDDFVDCRSCARQSTFCNNVPDAPL